MKSRTYNKFKARERSISTRRRANTPGRKSGGNGKNINQDTRHDRRDSKDTHKFRTDKKE